MNYELEIAMWGLLILGLAVTVIGIVVCLAPVMLSGEISQQEEQAMAHTDNGRAEEHDGEHHVR